jgi:ferrochelatase
MARYKDNLQPPQDNQPVTGILITNLGTPDAPTPAALRKYLAEFLSDPRVIETPKLIWWPILYGIVLTLRPRRSAAAYARIWTAEGSPLRTISQRQVSAITADVRDKSRVPVIVELAMRYGNPSIPSALNKMLAANVQRLLVLPLYPQYSATTTASTFDAVTAELRSWRRLPELRMITHYHDDPGYISSLGESIRVYRAKHGNPERLLFSFHGLPKKYSDAGDPYHHQCLKTARLVAEQLKLEPDHWTVAFQSRFGPLEWLRPYTAEVLQDWARAGISRIHVICPGFSADCLETLEEIEMQYREVFLGAGGKQYSYIPALNDEPGHIEVLTNIILKHCQGWIDKLGIKN